MTRLDKLGRAAFASDGRLDRVCVALVLATAGLVAWNALTFDMRLGYDAREHELYAVTLAQGRLPDKDDTREFFSPPLPYLLPSLLIAKGVPVASAIKVGQAQNVAVSLGLSLVLLLLAEELRPGSRTVKRMALFLLGTLPVYHRSFAFFRAEPLLAFLAAVALLLGLRLFVGAEVDGWRSRAAALGVVFGLVLLARQQGVFVIGAVMALALARALVDGPARQRHLRALALALMVGGVVGSWFYFSLWSRYGSPAAFNKYRAPVALSNRPAFFYFGTGDGLLFTDPVRPSFIGQFLPTMYADTWGDYYGYFLMYAWDARRDCYIRPADWEEFLAAKGHKGWLLTNRFSRAADLGRVNLVSLVPSLLLALGLAFGLGQAASLLARTPTRAKALAALLAVASVASVVGYVVLLLTIRHATGTTIKSVYMLQMLPLLALLGAMVAARVQDLAPRAFLLLMAALVAVGLHNAPFLVNALSRAPGAGAGPCAAEPWVG